MRNNRSTLIRNTIFVLAFLIVVCGIFIVHFPAYKSAFVTKYQNVSISDISKINSSMDDVLKQSLKSEFKRITSNVMGAFYKTTYTKIIGDFEYYWDGTRLYFCEKSINDIGLFSKEMLQLKNEAERYGSKLLYIQAPDFIADNESNAYLRQEISVSDEMDKLLGFFRENEISFLDMRQYVKTDENKIERGIPEEYRFKTDTHLTTVTEWWVLSQLVDYMGLDPTLLDWDLYDVVQNDFLGNQGRAVGEYLVSPDKFTRLYPDFPTSFKKTNVYTKETETGEFKETVMNGYPRAGDCYNYWVTDYFDYGQACITYDNLANENGKNVLFICDSIGYRTASYLSLFVDSITVLDPRFAGQTKYLWMPDYEYIFVMTQRGFGGNNFSRELLTSADAVIRDVEKKDGVLRVKVQNIGQGSWTEDISARLCLHVNGKDMLIRACLPENVIINQGETYVFEFDISKLEISSGSVYEVEMIQEGVSYFGERVDVSDILIRQQQYAMEFESVSQIHEDGVNKIQVVVTNKSNFAWSEEIGIRLAVFCDGTDTTRGCIEKGKQIFPGESYTFILEAEPLKQFSKISCQMVHEGIKYFGEQEEIK